MNQDKIIRRAEATARRLREQRSRGSKDPLYKEAHGAIMALLGVVSTKKEETP